MLQIIIIFLNILGFVQTERLGQIKANLATMNLWDWAVLHAGRVTGVAYLSSSSSCRTG